MKVVGFVGSPRNNGNTAALVDAVLEGVRKYEIATDRHIINEAEIKGCQSCYACVKEDRCSIDDHMQLFYEEIKQSNALVIGSPIYFGQVSGQTKLFMDRLFRFTSNPRKRIPHAPRSVFLVLTHGAATDDTYDSYAGYVSGYLKYAGLSVIKIISVGGCSISGESIHTRPEKIDLARGFGSDLGKFLIESEVQFKKHKVHEHDPNVPI